MKVLCKRDYFGFQKNKLYEVIDIHSIFEKDDFITIKSDDDRNLFLYRFRLNKSTEYNDMIGEFELYFGDYFCDIKETRMKKLNKINNAE